MAADKLHGRPTALGRVFARRAPAQPLPVDVVIVSADMDAMTIACVSELERCAVEQIVVVDNAFDPAAGAGREELAGRATIVALDSPHGFAAANNRGVARGHAPFVLLLNSDILVVEGAIERLLQALREHPNAVAAGGRLVDPETLETQSGYRPRPFPSLANFIVIMLGIEELWPANPVTSRYHGGLVDDTRVRAVEAQPAAAALMVSRADLEAAGGFDERFWFWFEDSDLLLRLRERGQILYVPPAVFRHLGGGDLQRLEQEPAHPLDLPRNAPIRRRAVRAPRAHAARAHGRGGEPSANRAVRPLAPRRGKRLACRGRRRNGPGAWRARARDRPLATGGSSLGGSRLALGHAGHRRRLLQDQDQLVVVALRSLQRERHVQLGL